MKKGDFVFVLLENGSWDYETTEDCQIHTDFDKVYNEFLQKVECAKSDILNFVDEEDVESEEEGELNGKDTEFYKISIWECGDWTKTHCDITIRRMEVQ